MIDPRLQEAVRAVLGDTGDGAATPDNAAEDNAAGQPDGSDAAGQSGEWNPDDSAAPADTAGLPPSADKAALIHLAAEQDPRMAPIAEAASSEIRIGPDGTITASPALRTAMRALVPGRDKAPSGANRVIGGWLTADATTAAPVTETSTYFTLSHWHWLAAMNLVRAIPADLGPTYPHLFISEAQIIHDLKAWSALDEHGKLTTEAEAMFGAVTGHAELTLYGTVLLYAQRRDPVKLPEMLKEFGLEAAVRDVPRVTFAIGITDREVVTALVNNTTVVFTRRLRRDEDTADAAAAVLELLDPDNQWPPYPLATPIVLPGELVDQLATGKDTGLLIDTEPGEDATEEEQDKDAAKRDKVRNSVRSVLGAAKTPAAAAEAIAEIASSTTHALAQITVRTSEVDVSRTDPGALAVVFLRDRGAVASYPSGTGQFRRITYVAANAPGITTGISVLRDSYRRG